jgi:hypothetical protein
MISRLTDEKESGGHDGQGARGTLNLAERTETSRESPHGF